MNWSDVGLLVGVLSPLVGVPLTVISLYLRAIREHQTQSMAEMTQRLQAVEACVQELLRAKADFEREYATKEEWVRESMLARQGLQRLTEMAVRIQAELESERSLAAELRRLAAAVVRVQRVDEPAASACSERPA